MAFAGVSLSIVSIAFTGSSVMRFQCIMCFTIIRVANTNRPKTLSCPNCSNTLAVPRSRFETGCVIGDFVIESLIGKGGMASVYLSRQLSMDRPAALKILEASYLKEDKYVERFVKEAKAAARINHPNLVTSVAVGHEEGALYYAMEYIEGMTLGELLEKEKTVDCDLGLNITQQCAEALYAAWTQEQIIHRDIKPDNIMLANDGYTKVMDLGIAITRSEAETADISGTPAYMSPEQFRGKALDCRSDIYSLGCTLYTALVGFTPFDGESANDIGRKHLYNQVIFPDKNLIMIPTRVKKLISRMMAKDPQERFQSYDELLEEVVYIRKRLAPDESLVPSVHTISFSKYRMREDMQAVESPSAIFRRRNEREKNVAIALKKAKQESSLLPWPTYIKVSLLVVILLFLVASTLGIMHLRRPTSYYHDSLSFIEQHPIPEDVEALKHLKQTATSLLANCPRDARIYDQLARAKLEGFIAMLSEHLLRSQYNALDEHQKRLTEQLLAVKEQRQKLSSETTSMLTDLESLRLRYAELENQFNEQLQDQFYRDQMRADLDAQASELAALAESLSNRERALGERFRAMLTWQVIDALTIYNFDKAKRLTLESDLGDPADIADAKKNLNRRVENAEMLYMRVKNSERLASGTRLSIGNLITITDGMVQVSDDRVGLIKYETYPLNTLPVEDILAIANTTWPADAGIPEFQQAAHDFAFTQGAFNLVRTLIKEPEVLGDFDTLLQTLLASRVREVEMLYESGNLRAASTIARKMLNDYAELPQFEIYSEQLRALFKLGTSRTVSKPPSVRPVEAATTDTPRDTPFQDSSLPPQEPNDGIVLPSFP